MTTFGVDLNEDVAGIKTSAYYGDPGDGSTAWYMQTAVADGGDVALGAVADAAVTSPASSGSVIALLKGILTKVTNIKVGLSSDGAASTTCPLNASTTALDDNLTIKTAAGALYRVTGLNTGPDQWIQLHQTNGAPSGGAVPVISFPVLADAAFQIDFGDMGRWFSTGIFVTNSTDADGYTVGSTDCLFDAQYR